VILGIMLSLRTNVSSSFLRLAIILKTRNKEGRGLLRTMHATSTIIPRPSISARTQRVTARTASMRILLYRSAIVSSTEAGPSSS
jgi:hypothetical protein